MKMYSFSVDTELLISVFMVQGRMAAFRVVSGLPEDAVIESAKLEGPLLKMTFSTQDEKFITANPGEAVYVTYQSPRDRRAKRLMSRMFEA